MPIPRFTLYRLHPLWLPLVILALVLLLILLAQLLLAWRSYERMLPVDQHLLHLEQLQHVVGKVEGRLAQQLPDNTPLAPADRHTLEQALVALLQQGGHRVATTPVQLQQVQALLSQPTTPARTTLLSSLNVLREAFRNESAAHRQLSRDLLNTARTELEMGVVILLLLPLGIGGLLVLLRQRIFAPLNWMADLLEQIGARRYQQIPASHIDPLFQPLVTNYNQMVLRLAELEAEHAHYEQQLEQHIQAATRTLIGQQRNLADSERLAVLGEVHARVAHELRNPLAGIKMACRSLYEDMQEQADVASYPERLALISRELERMGKLLDSLLDQARHQPEVPQRVVLHTAIEELLALARYQMPAHIQLQAQIPAEMVCYLPSIRLRQVLLNLILNAQNAMGEQAGTILLTAQHQGDTGVALSVCDEGSGFPPSMLGKQIQTFHSQRSGGTGLGLAMVQRFVRNLGGHLELRNRAPRGACVTLYLTCLEELAHA